MTVRLPIARFGRLGPGWYVEGDGWTMQPQGNLTISDAKRICVVTAAALRVSAAERATASTADVQTSDSDEAAMS